MYTFYTVFGSPVLHSKSPQLFSPMLEGSEHVCYTRIRPQSGKDLIQLAKELDIRGGSVTSPFKETILPLVDHASEDAFSIGAVNCIRNINGRIEGHNTDHYGVTGALQEGGLSLDGSRILVLGAGGAARAAVFGLVKAGARVCISNRTLTKAYALADAFGGEVISWDQPGTLPEFDAIVSALLPEALPPYMESISYGLLLDAIYKPSAVTEFSKKKGIPVIRGERWLVHQGMEAAAFYLGSKPDAATLSGQLNQPLDQEKLDIFVLHDNNIQAFYSKPHDLVISGHGLSPETINQLIHEEKRLAFGS